MTHLTVTRQGQPEPTRVVLELMLQAWARQDFDEAAAWFADNAVYVLHLPTAVVATGGENRGRAAARRAFLSQPQIWRHCAFEPVLRPTDGDTVRATVRFAYLHVPSGEVLEGRKQLCATVALRRVQRLEEFHDEALVEAFLRYVDWRSNQAEA